MDITKLNEFLAPYKIEIACESCQKKSEQRSKNQKECREDWNPTEILNAKSKSFPKPPSRGHSFSQTKKIKTNRGFETREINQQKTQKAEGGVSQSNLGHVHKIAPFSRPILLFNPPNHILNLNGFADQVGQNQGIHELLETHRDTPNKIEEVDIDRFYHSEKKGNAFNFKQNLTNSTAQPMLFGADESPISNRRQTRNHWSEQLYFEMAQGGMPSRDASPFQTPYRRNPETPSNRDHTPLNQSQLTPNMRGLDNFEETEQDNFNLLENPFEEKL